MPVLTRLPTGALTVTVVWLVLVSATRADPLPQQSGKVDLASTAHVNIQVNGTAIDDLAGFSVAGAGDVNDDGVDDFVVGAPSVDSLGNADSGAAFVVFAKRPFARNRTVNLGDIGTTGNTDGFRINGPPPENPDISVFAGVVVAGGGDIDDDGYEDVVIASPFAGSNFQGAAWVVRGKSTYASVNLGDFGQQGNQQGFRIQGAIDYDAAGFSAAIVPDMTDDHMDEIVTGAPGTAFNGRDASGSAYVVFGRKADYSTLDLSQIGGSNGPGFRIDGAVPGNPIAFDGAGNSVAAIPNMNDLDRPEPEVALTVPHTGVTYVVFGRRIPGAIDLAGIGVPGNTDGFAINGFTETDAQLAVGGVPDMSQDGRGEVIVGFTGADNNGRTNSGSAYVIFGKPGYATESLASIGTPGNEGFRIDGAAAGDRAGFSVQGSGDVNDDRLADMIVGAPYADGFSRQRADSGVAYAVYGRSVSTPTPVQLADIGSTGNTDGFLMDGAATNNYAGTSVSGAGDVNGDGHDDVIVGAPSAQVSGQMRGAAYVIFGFGTSSISYHPSSIAGHVGEPIPSLRPTVDRTGDATYSISPPLPGNLTFDTRTGLIAGTPAAEQPPTSYTVTMTDLIGPVTTAVTIEVGPAQGIDLLTQANIELDGATQGDQAGYSVAPAGFVNDDQIADVIVGAPMTNSKGLIDSGAAYVIYGRDRPSPVDLSQIGVPGNDDGFLIRGARARDQAGFSVAGGHDVNGDGLDDVVVGANQAARPNAPGAGFAYVVLSDASDPFGTVDLARIGAYGNTDGFRIVGAYATDAAGFAVSSVGDLNGDGKAEVVVGAPYADHGSRFDAGKTYVVWGKSQTGKLSTVDLRSTGSGAFYQIAGAAPYNYAGWSVASSPDINGDGLDEVIVGAPLALNTLGQDSGVAYVVWGKGTTNGIDLSRLGSAGVRINGDQAGDSVGASVSGAPDMNRDQRPEVVIGAPDAHQAGTDSGSTYAIFGTTTPSIFLASLVEGQGFRIDGAAPGDHAGYAVAGVSDQNSDGLADLLIGAPHADNRHGTNSGSAYLTYGKTSIDVVDLGNLGAAGYRIDGAGAGDQAGFSVASSGDFDGDTDSDLLIGANLAARNARVGSGSAYVLYGASAP